MRAIRNFVGLGEILEPSFWEIQIKLPYLQTKNEHVERIIVPNFHLIKLTISVIDDKCELRYVVTSALHKMLRT
jgi:hypothetical protein